MADEQNIGDQYFTGEDKSLTFTIRQAASASAPAQDISGWAISWLVKRRKRDADAAAIVTKTTVAGITLTTPLSGICTVAIEDSDIVAIVGGKVYYHELKRTDPGLERVLSHGTFILNQAVHN